MLWAVAREAHLSMGFSRQESWKGLPFLSLIPSLLHKNWRQAVVNRHNTLEIIFLYSLITIENQHVKITIRLWASSGRWWRTGKPGKLQSMRSQRVSCQTRLSGWQPTDAAQSLSPMAFFIELEQNNLKICVETRKTLDIESKLEKEKQSWRNQVPWFQTILPS